MLPRMVRGVSLLGWCLLAETLDLGFQDCHPAKDLTQLRIRCVAGKLEADERTEVLKKFAKHLCSFVWLIVFGHNRHVDSRLP